MKYLKLILAGQLLITVVVLSIYGIKYVAIWIIKFVDMGFLSNYMWLSGICFVVLSILALVKWIKSKMI